jgi:O-antigen/teichoic acid export membrane protein
VYYSWRKELSQERALEQSRHTLIAVITIGAVAALGEGTVGAIILRYFMPESYRGSVPLVGLLAACVFARAVYFVLGAELFFAKRTTALAVIFFSGAGATLLLTAVLVPPLGAVGAALAQFGGTALSVVLSAVAAQKTFPLRAGPRILVAAVFAVFASSTAPFLQRVGTLGYDLLIAIITFTLLGLVMLLVAGFTRKSAQQAWAVLRRRG